MNLTQLILQSVYFIVPAYFANMAPVIAKRLKIFERANKPVDFNAKAFDGRPLFGKNKTVRGFIFGVAAGIVLVFLQRILYAFESFRWISITDYSSFLLLGTLMGFGALSGDVIKSFFKRRFNIKPGKKFIPFDQTDFVIGAYLFVFPFYSSMISWELFFSSLIVSFFLHILVNHVAYYLNIRKEKW